MDEFEVPDDISSLYDSMVQSFEFSEEEARRFSSQTGLLLNGMNVLVNELCKHIIRLNPDRAHLAYTRMLICIGDYELAIQAVNSPREVTSWVVSIGRNYELDIGGE